MRIIIPSTSTCASASISLADEPTGNRDECAIFLSRVKISADDADRLLAMLSPGYASLLPDPRQALKEQAMVFVQEDDPADVSARSTFNP